MNRHGALNRIYRLVWSDRLAAWVAAAHAAVAAVAAGKVDAARDAAVSRAEQAITHITRAIELENARDASPRP